MTAPRRTRVMDWEIVTAEAVGEAAGRGPRIKAAAEGRAWNGVPLARAVVVGEAAEIVRLVQAAPEEPEEITVAVAGVVHSTIQSRAWAVQVLRGWSLSPIRP